jgi:hypothetical protein
METSYRGLILENNGMPLPIKKSLFVNKVACHDFWEYGPRIWPIVPYFKENKAQFWQKTLKKTIYLCNNMCTNQEPKINDYTFFYSTQKSSFWI